MDTKRKIFLLNTKIMQDIVAQFYEPENQSRCKKWVFKKHVFPKHPMSERTFWRMLGTDVSELENGISQA